MSERYDAQVRAALTALSVRPPDAFLWFGRRTEVARADALGAAIGARLETDFFMPGAPRPAPHRDRRTPSDADGAFSRALAQANCGRGSWQPGWRVAAVEQDAVAVVRPGDGLRLLAPAADCRLEGALADVRLPKDLAGLAPGIYRALGDAPAPPGAAERARLYWDIAAAGAVTFVARVTYALNQAGLPFTLELVDDPARYRQRPAAELVLARADFAAAIARLRPLLRALGPHLTDRVPAFTKPLSRGLALAEETAGAERFGAHRCRLLAEAIAGAGDRALDERLAAVRARFAGAGISLAAPYLQQGSSDAYDGS